MCVIRVARARGRSCHRNVAEPPFRSPALKKRLIIQRRALYGPIPVKTETFREL